MLQREILGQAFLNHLMISIRDKIVFVRCWPLDNGWLFVLYFMSEEITRYWIRGMKIYLKLTYVNDQPTYITLSGSYFRDKIINVYFSAYINMEIHDICNLPIEFSSSYLPLLSENRKINILCKFSFL